MRYQVPLFIEHEPKVVGPFTFRQFLYLLLPGSAAFFSYFILPFSLFLVVAISLSMLGLALGFVKIGGKDLPDGKQELDFDEDEFKDLMESAEICPVNVIHILKEKKKLI